MIWGLIEKTMSLNRKTYWRFIKRKKEWLLREKMWNLWLRKSTLEKERKFSRLIIISWILIINLSFQNSVLNKILVRSSSLDLRIIFLCKKCPWDNKENVLRMSFQSLWKLVLKMPKIDSRLKNQLRKHTGMIWLLHSQHSLKELY